MTFFRFLDFRKTFPAGKGAAADYHHVLRSIVFPFIPLDQFLLILADAQQQGHIDAQGVGDVDQGGQGNAVVVGAPFQPGDGVRMEIGQFRNVGLAQAALVHAAQGAVVADLGADQFADQLFFRVQSLSASILSNGI